MINFLVFSLVIASTLKQNDCRSTKEIEATSHETLEPDIKRLHDKYRDSKDTDNLQSESTEGDDVNPFKEQERREISMQTETEEYIEDNLEPYVEPDNYEPYRKTENVRSNVEVKKTESVLKGPEKFEPIKLVNVKPNTEPDNIELQKKPVNIDLIKKSEGVESSTISQILDPDTKILEKVGSNDKKPLKLNSEDKDSKLSMNIELSNSAENMTTLTSHSKEKIEKSVKDTEKLDFAENITIFKALSKEKDDKGKSIAHNKAILNPRAKENNAKSAERSELSSSAENMTIVSSSDEIVIRSKSDGNITTLKPIETTSKQIIKENDVKPVKNVDWSSSAENMTVVSSSAENMTDVLSSAENETIKPSSDKNITFYSNNKTEKTNDAKETKRLFEEEASTEDVSFRTTPKLLFPLVTMDDVSHNRTVELIKMVNEAKVELHKVKLFKPSQVKYSPDLIKDKNKTIYSIPIFHSTNISELQNKTAELIQNVNEREVMSASVKPSNTFIDQTKNDQESLIDHDVLDQFDDYLFRRNFQNLRRSNPIVYALYKPDAKKDTENDERRYIISNFDVVESYMKNVRKNLYIDQKSDTPQQDDNTPENGNNEKERMEDGEIENLYNKVNYDEKDDDYIVSTKRNVWDYEHENWATSNLDWSNMKSSRENDERKEAKEDRNNKYETEEEEHNTLTTTEKNYDDKDELVKVTTSLNIDGDSNNAWGSNKKQKNYKLLLQTQKSLDEYFKENSIIKKRTTKEPQHDDRKKLKHKSKSSKKKRGHRRHKNNRKRSDINGDEQRTARFNKSHRRNKSNKIPSVSNRKKSDKDEILDNTDKEAIEKKVTRMEEIHENKSQRPSSSKKTDGSEYHDMPDKDKISKKRRKDEQDRLEGPSTHQKSNKNSKKINDDMDFGKKKSAADNKLYSDEKMDSTKDKKHKEKSNYDYKDSYDYNSNKKKNLRYDDKKNDDDYKNGKDIKYDYKDNSMKGSKISHKDSRDYRDDYGGNKKSSKMSYKDNKDYNDNYDKSKKMEYKQEGHMIDKWIDQGDKYGDKKKKSKYSDYGDIDKDYDMPKKKKQSSNLYHDDYRDSRETKSKGLIKNTKDRDEFPNKFGGNKESIWDKHANNDWDKVGIVTTRMTPRTTTTFRTTKRYIDDDYGDSFRDKDFGKRKEKQMPFKNEKLAIFHENNNWDKIGVDDVHYQSKPSKSSRNKKHNDRGSSSYVGSTYVRTPLPYKEGHSVFDDD